MKRHYYRAVMPVVFASLVLSACAANTPAPTNTLVPTLEPTTTFTPEPTATKTPKPTSTPQPSPTPNLKATEQYEGMVAKVEEYYDKGYISTTDGVYQRLEDFTDEWAQINWYQWTYVTSVAPTHFIISSDVAWESASKSANPSGCGYVFRIQGNDDHYMIFISLDGYVYSGSSLDRGWSSMGSGYYGPGVTNGSANLTLIMEDSTYIVLVNDKLIKKYTGFQGKLTKGNLAYTVVSGINKSFGTRCTFKNTDLWAIKK